MMDYGDTNFQTAVLKDAIDLNEEFTLSKTNFNVAFGLFDPLKGEVIDESKYFVWSAHIRVMETPHDVEPDIIPVALRKCTEQDKKDFFPDIAPDLEPILLQMFCLDNPEKVKFIGNVLKGRSQSFFVQLNRC